MDDLDIVTAELEAAGSPTIEGDELRLLRRVRRLGVAGHWAASEEADALLEVVLDAAEGDAPKAQHPEV